MWILTVRSPSSEPREYILKDAKTTIGRKPDNDIIISDESASRSHAEIFCDGDQVVISDLDSTNGTYVNRERITQPHALHPDDQIRIGQYVASLSIRDDKSTDLVAALSGTQPLTRDLLLESVDQHAVLLYEVSKRLNTILELDIALDEVSKLMQVSMGADRCGVILAEYFDRLEELGFPTAYARDAIDKHSVVIFSNSPFPNERTLSRSASLLGIRSVLCVPVMIEGEVLALIYVYKTNPASRPFDQHDVQLAVAISYQAALTIQRTRLLEKSQLLEQLAVTDSLTGLYNRRQFTELAEREFQRAKRHNHDLTAMMVDVDNFKQVNDVHGHAVGDQVLIVLAECFRVELRVLDLIGRYGGDEFVTLLLETDIDDAIGVAERLRRRVAATPIKTKAGNIKFTVSIGCAAYAVTDEDLGNLLNRADASLYEAKKAGKNRVEAAQTS